MTTQELKKFTNKVSSDITKITQAYTTTQENMGKLIENMILQALTKAWDVTIPSATVHSRNLDDNHATNSSNETKWTPFWSTANLTMPQQHENGTHQTERLYEAHT